jgi:hypothetical protein
MALHVGGGGVVAGADDRIGIYALHIVNDCRAQGARCRGIRTMGHESILPPVRMAFEIAITDPTAPFLYDRPRAGILNDFGIPLQVTC